MKIASLKLAGRTFLAPLAGITNLPFRRLTKSCGCAVVCSEMISAKGLFYNGEKTMSLLASCSEERPLSVQLFGAEPEIMAKAAIHIQDLGIADIIDINFGCSVRKVLKQGAGVALMKDPKLSEQILKALRKAVDLPLTIKIRTGWHPDGSDALALSRIAQDCGVDAIAVHPRTATQLFRGKADWTLIKRIKEISSIPIIGNGDVNSVEDAARITDLTGCDGIMVGRAALSNPFLLAQIEEWFRTGTYTTHPPADIFRCMKQLIRMYVAHFGQQTGCKMLRGRLAWFIKGLPGASIFRQQLSRIRAEDEALQLIQAFEKGLSESGSEDRLI